jgi:MoaA/NifB/PqqE/SkfB family radical SAM enzyme
MPAAAKRPSGEVYEIWNDKVEEVWNGPEIREIRRRMLAGEKVEFCSKCYEEEAAGSRSLRIDHTEQWFSEMGDGLRQRIDESREDGRVKKLPVWMELKLGNVCNLRCRMCCPSDSNQIQAEYQEIGDADPYFEGLWGHQRTLLWHHKPIPLAEMPPWYSSRFLWDQIDALLPDMLKVNMVGGEPTMIEEIYGFLEKAVASGDAKHLELQFNTNLTSLRPRFLELLPHFRMVRFTASVDGYGKLQEYIRHPARWESIDRNYRTVAKSVAPNTLLVVSPTIQIYNVLQITDIFRWVESVHEWTTHPPITPAMLDHPNYLNVRILPPEIRALAADRLEAYRENGALPKRISWFHERLGVFVNLLRAEYEPRPELLEAFMRFTEILDKKRGERLADAAPELYSLLQKAL